MKYNHFLNLYLLFLSNSPTGQTAHHIFTLMAQMTRTHARVCPFLAFVDIAVHLGYHIAQKKNNFGGMNRRKRAKYYYII